MGNVSRKVRIGRMTMLPNQYCKIHKIFSCYINKVNLKKNNATLGKNKKENVQEKIFSEMRNKPKSVFMNVNVA